MCDSKQRRNNHTHFLILRTVPAWCSEVKVKVIQLCPTLCNPTDYTVLGTLQARILEWVAFPFSRGSSQPRDWTQVSCIAGGLFTSWATREALRDVKQVFYPCFRTGKLGLCDVSWFFLCTSACRLWRKVSTSKFSALPNTSLCFAGKLFTQYLSTNSTK